MPKYTIVLSRKAQKELDKLSDKIAEPIFNAIEKLEFNPRPVGCKKLKGRDSYRIRVANYHIIYEILMIFFWWMSLTWAIERIFMVN